MVDGFLDAAGIFADAPPAGGCRAQGDECARTGGDIHAGQVGVVGGGDEASSLFCGQASGDLVCPAEGIAGANGLCAFNPCSSACRFRAYTPSPRVPSSAVPIAPPNS